MQRGYIAVKARSFRSGEGHWRPGFRGQQQAGQQHQVGYAQVQGSTPVLFVEFSSQAVHSQEQPRYPSRTGCRAQRLPGFLLRPAADLLCSLLKQQRCCQALQLQAPCRGLTSWLSLAAQLVNCACPASPGLMLLLLTQQSALASHFAMLFLTRTW